MSVLTVIEEQGIVGVRVRLGWFGRPVAQIKRGRVKEWLVGRPSGVPRIEQISDTGWRDAGRADAIELAAFLASLQADGPEIPERHTAARRHGSNGPPPPGPRPPPPPNPPLPRGG